jgi:hypothetical protein
MAGMNMIGLGLEVCVCAAACERRAFRPGDDSVAMTLVEVMCKDVCGSVKKPIKAIRAVDHAVRRSPGSGPSVLLQDRIAEEPGIRAKSERL